MKKFPDFLADLIVVINLNMWRISEGRMVVTIFRLYFLKNKIKRCLKYIRKYDNFKVIF